MSIGTKLAILLYICLALHHRAAESNPAEKRVARSSNDLYDWLTSLFDYEDSEEYLLCRNCTVVVAQGQRNGTDATAAPVAPTATAPTATPSGNGAPASGNGDATNAPNVTPTAATAAPTPPAGDAPATPTAAPAEG